MQVDTNNDRVGTADDAEIDDRIKGVNHGLVKYQLLMSNVTENFDTWIKKVSRNA